MTIDLLPKSDDYRMKTMIFVNSGSSAYMELPINETSALLGDNNGGKTSALNALKLFLLPEVNMRDCFNKFGFASGGVKYEGLDSHNFYFPHSTSFVILEATNPLGDFCIVLYANPKEELGYSRTAVPVNYDRIRDLFWNVDACGNGGLGAFAVDLSHSDVLSALKKLESESLPDREHIRNALYTRCSPIKPETRFCLMPLAQRPSSATMSSIKSLLQLAFDIKASNDATLPMAFANIIDSDIATKNESLKIDFNQIQTGREELTILSSHVQNLRRHFSHWESLKQHKTSYQIDLIDWRKDFSKIKSTVVYHAQSHDEVYAGSKRRLDEATQHARVCSNELSTHREIQRNYKADLQSCTKDLATLQEQVDRITEMRRESSMVIGEASDEAMIEYLNTLTKECSDKLQSLDSEQAIVARLENLIRKKGGLQQAISDLTICVGNDEPSLLEHLESEHAKTVLNSINPAFRKISATPTASQIGDFEAFAANFSTGSTLDLCGQSLPGVHLSEFNPDLYRAEKQSQLDQASEDLSTTTVDIEECRKSLKGNAESRAAEMRGLRVEIDGFEQDIKALKGSDYILTQHGEKTIRAEALQEKVDNQEVLVNTLSMDAATAIELKNKAADTHEGISKLQHLLNDCDRQLKQTTIMTGGDLGSVPSIIDVEPLEGDPAQLDLYNSIAALQTRTGAIKSQRNHALDSLRVLATANLSKVSVDSAYNANIMGSEFNEAYEILRSEFEHIDVREKEYLAKVVEHNHDTNRQLSFLERIDTAINNFQSKLNTEFGDIQISNLTSVNVVIETHKGFDTLRRELEQQGSGAGTDTMMSDSFYARLDDFCSKYLTTAAGQGKLNLEKIITKVRYVYEINGKKVTKAQSNGTSGMINAALLSILLKRLVPDDISLSLPIVYDEVDSLDAKNLPTLRNVVEGHDFILLVANPVNTGGIAHHIGKWHDLFVHVLSDIDAIGECQVVYRPVVESLSRCGTVAGATTDVVAPVSEVAPV